MKKVAFKKKIVLREEEAKEIERLGERHAGLQWREMKGLILRCKRGRKKETKALDENGVEVSGEEVLEVWRKAYEKLGKEGGGHFLRLRYIWKCLCKGVQDFRLSHTLTHSFSHNNTLFTHFSHNLSYWGKKRAN